MVDGTFAMIPILVLIGPDSRGGAIRPLVQASPSDSLNAFRAILSWRVARALDCGAGQWSWTVQAIDLFGMVEELVQHVGAVRGEEDLALVRRLAPGDFSEDLDHFPDQLGMDAVFRFLQGNQRRNSSR